MVTWHDLTPTQQNQARTQLTQKQLNAILLHDTWKLSYTDTAHMLKTTRTAARSRIRAARVILDRIAQQEAA